MNVLAIGCHPDDVEICYMDTLAGVNFVPDEFVDISDEIDLKILMLECHHRCKAYLKGTTRRFLP